MSILFISPVKVLISITAWTSPVLSTVLLLEPRTLRLEQSLTTTGADQIFAELLKEKKNSRPLVISASTKQKDNFVRQLQKYLYIM